MKPIQIDIRAFGFGFEATFGKLMTVEEAEQLEVNDVSSDTAIAPDEECDCDDCEPEFRLGFQPNPIRKVSARVAPWAGGASNE